MAENQQLGEKFHLKNRSTQVGSDGDPHFTEHLGFFSSGRDASMLALASHWCPRWQEVEQRSEVQGGVKSRLCLTAYLLMISNSSRLGKHRTR